MPDNTSQQTDAARSDRELRDAASPRALQVGDDTVDGRDEPIGEVVLTSLADDLIRGAKAIGEFIGVSERRARHLLEIKEDRASVIPRWKEGAVFVASRKVLTAFYAERVQQYGTINGTAINGNGGDDHDAEPAPTPSGRRRRTRRRPITRRPS
jgi:hypothetical protein